MIKSNKTVTKRMHDMPNSEGPYISISKYFFHHVFNWYKIIYILLITAYH